MSKLRLILALLLSVTLGSVAHAAPTQFTSPTYTIGSVIFGGTGVLRLPNSTTPPSILTGPTVGSITTTTAVVSWTVDRNTTGIVFVGTTSGNYTFQAGDAFTPSTSIHNVTLNFLQKATTYYYKVRSSDVYGNQVESTESTFQSDAGDITPPTILTGPSAAQTSGNQVTVTWTTDKLSSSIVEYGVADVTENSVGRTSERTLFHQVVLSGLEGGQTYKFHVKSADASDNSVTSPTQTFTTTTAPGITSVRITDITLTSAVVQWQTTVASSTHVRYGTKSGDYTVTSDDASLSEVHLVRLPNLSSGTTFYLRLSGSDAAGSTITSDEYVFKTVILPVISDIKVTKVTASTATVSWTATSEIDGLVQGKITKNEDSTLVGKPIVAADNVLATTHSLDLVDLDSSTTYEITAYGKDQFGNQAISPTVTFTTPVDTEPPAIENLRNDTTIDLGSRQTVQVLVSFGLSKKARATIEYGEGATGSYTKKVDTDTDYSKNKFLVIPALKPGNSYHFRVVAVDKAGNTSSSPDYLVLAPAQPVSLLDLIFGQIRSNFGWLGGL